jgi:hypothetical protein
MYSSKRLLLVIPALAVAYFVAVNFIAGTKDDVQPQNTTSPTSQTSTSSPGTGLFKDVAMNIELDMDVEESIDVVAYAAETSFLNSGCARASEIIYLGRGGDDQQIGILYRCTKAIWEYSAEASNPSAKLITGNGSEVIVYVENTSTEFEAGSPMEREFNEISKLFEQSELYSFQ